MNELFTPPPLQQAPTNDFSQPQISNQEQPSNNKRLIIIVGVIILIVLSFVFGYLAMQNSLKPNQLSDEFNQENNGLPNITEPFNQQDQNVRYDLGIETTIFTINELGIEIELAEKYSILEPKYSSAFLEVSDYDIVRFELPLPSEGAEASQTIFSIARFKSRVDIDQDQAGSFGIKLLETADGYTYILYPMGQVGIDRDQPEYQTFRTLLGLKAENLQIRTISTNN